MTTVTWDDLAVLRGPEPKEKHIDRVMASGVPFTFFRKRVQALGYRMERGEDGFAQMVWPSGSKMARDHERRLIEQIQQEYGETYNSR